MFRKALGRCAAAAVLLFAAAAHAQLSGRSSEVVVSGASVTGKGATGVPVGGPLGGPGFGAGEDLPFEASDAGRFPIIDFDSQGETVYTAADRRVEISATPLFFTPAPMTAPAPILPNAGMRFLTGGFSLTGSGDIDLAADRMLTVVGLTFTNLGPAAGTLLVVAIDNASFAAEPGDVTIGYTLSGEVVGGELANLFETGRVSIPVSGEGSTFNGFDSDFEAGAKGQIVSATVFAPTGACCLPEGDCITTTEGECAALGGDYRGDGTTCESIDQFISITVDPAGGDDAGDIAEIATSFNPSTSVFSYRVTLLPKNGVVANAFTTIVNDGPNPVVGDTGELAIFYLDASRPGDTRLSVYAYNAGATETIRFNSFLDGNGDGVGGDADLIACSEIDDSFILGLDDTQNPDGSRTLGFTIDAAVVLEHMPAFPTPGVDYTGVGFGQTIGYWTHPAVVATEYDGVDCLTRFDRALRSFADVINQPASFLGCIPPPPPPPAPGPRLVFAFDEQQGGTVGDAVGGLDLSIVESGGEARWVNDPRFGTGLEFAQNIVTGEVRATTQASSQTDPLRSLFSVADGLTLSALVRVDAAAAGGGRIFNWTGANLNENRNLTLQAHSAEGGLFDLDARLRTSDGGVVSLWIPDVLVAGETAHVAITYARSPGRLRMFVNGVEVGRRDGLGGGFWTWGQYNLLLGNEIGGLRAFDGVLYHVELATGAASDSDIMADAIAKLNPGFDAPISPAPVLHWSFNEQGGGTVHDEAGGVDLHLRLNGGDDDDDDDEDEEDEDDDEGDDDADQPAIRWVFDPLYGSGLEFDQDVFEGRACAETASTGTARDFRERLDAGDTLTLLVVARVDDARPNGSRLFSYSSGTSVDDRNLTLLVQPDGDMLDLEIRLRTTHSGVRQLEVDNALARGVPAAVAVTYSHEDGTLRAFVDGAPVGSLGGFSGGFAGWTDRMVYLGNEEGGRRAIDGVFFDVKAWDAVLDAEQLLHEAWSGLNIPAPGGGPVVPGGHAGLDLPAPALAWAFDEQAGTVVTDSAGELDLQIHEHNGDVVWVDDPIYGTGLRFDQHAQHGRSRAESVGASAARPLRELLDEDDELTLQVVARVDGVHNKGSRLVSYSSGTSVADRNVSLLARPPVAPGEGFQLEVRFRTTNTGVRRLFVDDALAPGVTSALSLTYTASSGTVRIFRDGTPIASFGGFSGGFAGWTDRVVFLGNEEGDRRPLDGVLYDVRAWGAALEDGQIFDAAMIGLGVLAP